MQISAISDLMSNRAIYSKLRSSKNINSHFNGNVQSFKGEYQSDKEKCEKITLDDGRTAFIYYDENGYKLQVKVLPDRRGFYDYTDNCIPMYHGENITGRYTVKSGDGSEIEYGFFYNRDKNIMERRLVLGIFKII